MKAKHELDVFYYRGLIEWGSLEAGYRWIEGFSRGKDCPQYPWHTMRTIKKYDRDPNKRLIFVDLVRKTAKWANGHDATSAAVRAGLL